MRPPLLAVILVPRTCYPYRLLSDRSNSRISHFISSIHPPIAGSIHRPPHTCLRYHRTRTQHHTPNSANCAQRSNISHPLMLPNSSLAPVISEVTGRHQVQELTEHPLQRHPTVAVEAMDQRRQPAALNSGTPTPTPDTVPPAAQRPQAFRRPHHKSRLGCVQCKQRKIKVNISRYCQLGVL